MLIGISAPIREQQQVSGTHQPDAPQQLSEVGHAVYQDRNVVARRPGNPIATTAVQPRRRIAPLRRRQKPLSYAHETIQPHESPAT
jgi:hypothetical protein